MIYIVFHNIKQGIRQYPVDCYWYFVNDVVAD